MKTASRILLTFVMMVFFTGMTYSQVASTTNPAKTSTKATTQAPAKSTDNAKAGTCPNHEAKAACAPGKNFVDKNGDGKCDNCGSTGKCTGDCGKGKGNGNCCAAGKSAGNGCGQGKGQMTGCSKKCETPCTAPKK